MDWIRDRVEAGVRCSSVALLSLAMLLALGGEAAAVPITVPSGLSPGDQYRLAFVTSTTRDSLSADIADYNAFVTAAANSVPELLALGTTWTAIASTPAVDARDNTGTNPGASVGVPIYRLDDTLMAGGNADLWDGAIAAPLMIVETGAVGAPFQPVWTGTSTDGTGFGGFELGSGGSAFYGRSDQSSDFWIILPNGIASHGFSYPLYAVSDPLTVVPEPGTSFLLGMGLAGLAAVGRRREP